jgi:hypothetical protein
MAIRELKVCLLGVSPGRHPPGPLGRAPPVLGAPRPGAPLSPRRPGPAAFDPSSLPPAPGLRSVPRSPSAAACCWLPGSLTGHSFLPRPSAAPALPGCPHGAGTLGRDRDRDGGRVPGHRRDPEGVVRVLVISFWPSVEVTQPSAVLTCLPGSRFSHLL